MTSKTVQEITEPLEPWLERIIDHALLKHVQQCPIEPRIRKLEIRFATLVGWMAGAGACGGVTGSILTLVVPFLRGSP